MVSSVSAVLTPVSQKGPKGGKEGIAALNCGQRPDKPSGGRWK